MHAQGAAATFGENGKIASGLRGLDDTESVFLPRHGQIAGAVTSDLQKNAAVRPAFVGLPGRVQKARTETKDCGDFFLITHSMPQALQPFFIFHIHRDVAEDCKVIACAEPRNMGPQNVRDRKSTRLNSSHEWT